MTLKGDAKFEEKLTCALENNMRNLANFHQNNWKSQSWDIDGILLSSVGKYELKIHRGVMSHDNEEWCKIWRGTDLSFQTWHEEFDEFWTRALESLKNFHFNVLLLSKVYIAWAKKVQRSYLSWNWRRIQNLERNWLVV